MEEGCCEGGHVCSDSGVLLADLAFGGTADYGLRELGGVGKVLGPV